MEKSEKIRVLITNDDGFKSGNIQALARALASVALVYVFAPESEQSGVGQAFTVRRGLKVEKICEMGEDSPYTMYSVSGTPADCAKFAIGHFAKELDIEFDLCFSGVNVGENAGVSSLYSGTVAGAREAALWGVPSVALSLHGIHGDMLEDSLEFAKHVVTEGLYRHIAPHTFWNVNFPKNKYGAIKGYRSAKMALDMFTDHYSHADGLWQLDGEKPWQNAADGTDDSLLHQGYVTITPHRVDQTDFESLKIIDELMKVKEG
ncbi:MAG: 5'/3'-nucleotidase SurE [Fibrobacter sp.]|nr:5'/3'-nucleotidase SurE [Fibrobacter sp.]